MMCILCCIVLPLTQVELISMYIVVLALICFYEYFKSVSKVSDYFNLLILHSVNCIKWYALVTLLFSNFVFIYSSSCEHIAPHVFVS